MQVPAHGPPDASPAYRVVRSRPAGACPPSACIWPPCPLLRPHPASLRRPPQGHPGLGARGGQAFPSPRAGGRACLGSGIVLLADSGSGEGRPPVQRPPHCVLAWRKGRELPGLSSRGTSGPPEGPTLVTRSVPEGPPAPHTVTVGRRFQRGHFGGAHARPQQWAELRAVCTRGTLHLAVVPCSRARQGWQSQASALTCRRSTSLLSGRTAPPPGGLGAEWGRLPDPPAFRLPHTNRRYARGTCPGGCTLVRERAQKEAGAVRAGVPLGRGGRRAPEWEGTGFHEALPPPWSRRPDAATTLFTRWKEKGDLISLV